MLGRRQPAPEKMAPLVLEKVGTQIATDLSVITPYEGSEPLILSWDETRAMAERYSVQLALTTNMQFLDEQKFYELKDVVEMVVMSIDSHLPEVFEKIRPGASRTWCSRTSRARRASATSTASSASPRPCS